MRIDRQDFARRAHLAADAVGERLRQEALP